MMTPKRPQAVVGLIRPYSSTLRDPVILCLKNRRTGSWGLPGGKVDPGELRGQAFVREMHEELGIEVTGMTRIFSADTFEHHTTVFRVDDYEGMPRSVEGPEMCWETYKFLLDKMCTHRQFHLELFYKLGWATDADWRAF